MKKVLSFVLALVMVLALSVTAFAEETPTTTQTEPNNQQEYRDITAGYTKESHTKGATVYYFTITWTPNQTNDLAYTGEQATYVWNTDSLSYTKATDGHVEAAWSGSAGYSVELVNKSNAALKVTSAVENSYNLTLTKTGADEQTAASADATIDFKDSTATGTEGKANYSWTFAANKDATAINETASGTVNVAKVTITVNKAA